jgi:geranylgeranyl diphosphate synthase type II
VIDRDFYRRGVPNVAGWFRTTAENNGILTADAEHGALSAGVLAGDLALSNAYRLLRQVETDSATRRRLDDIFDDAVFASIAGEYLDLEFTGMPKMPTQEKIIQAARLKTSAYSFEAPLQAGAVLAGAEDKVVAALKDFGRYAGIAYQIVDDILGVFGDESSTGKTNWGDLREGKRTALLSFAVGCPQWSTISPMIGSGAMSASDADYVRQVLIECGARGYSASLATEYAQRAESCLEAGEFSAPLRAALLRVVDAVVNRVR